MDEGWNKVLLIKKLINDAKSVLLNKSSDILITLNKNHTEDTNAVVELKESIVNNNDDIKSKMTSDKADIMKAIEGVQGLFSKSTQVNLETPDALIGKTYYDGVNLKTGTMVDKRNTNEYSATLTVDTTNSEIELTIPERGLYDVNNKLKCAFSKLRTAIGLTADKIAYGNTILGLAGTKKVIDSIMEVITQKESTITNSSSVDDIKNYLDNNLSSKFPYAGADNTSTDKHTLNISGYKRYLACHLFYADNGNPLDWGITTSRGTSSRILYVIGGGGSGYAIYLINVGDTNGITLNTASHGWGPLTVLGIQ